MTATASDKEAVNYQAEIANVLEETGFKIEIDNAPVEKPSEETSAGVEMIVKDETIRPVHAFRIVQAFRHAGITVATRVNALRRRNNTLYITVGPKDLPSREAPLPSWPSKSMAFVLVKWKQFLALA
jgi:hypothetical protein